MIFSHSFDRNWSCKGTVEFFLKFMYLFLQLEQGQPRVVSSVELSNSDMVVLWFNPNWQLSPIQPLVHILPREWEG